MRKVLGGLALAITASLLAASLAFAAGPAQDLGALNQHIDAALAQLQAGNVAGAQTEYQQFDDGWRSIEAGVRNQDRALYRAIEQQMTEVQTAFATQPPDPARIKAALQAQDAVDDQFIATYGSESAAGASSAAQRESNPSGMAAEIQHLDNAQARIAAHDASGAAAEVKAFIAGWPDVEGPVLAKAPETYTATENEMAQAYGLLTSNPPNMAQASSVIAQTEAGLQPFAEAPVQYSIFDAAIILLREGFEALLVVGALLAFLKRTGNGAKQRWIWGGGLAGLALSAVIAVTVNVLFAEAGGSSRELLEGVTGLVAAAMLIWMMFWLHSKATISAWSRYVAQSAGRALETNSLISLGLIAFLAVLREGAETVLFYVGIAPAISRADLFAGLAIGAAALVIIAVLMLIVGVRIPIRPFFLATSALIFFLAFKFVGFGIHSLQVSGHLASHAAPIPTVSVVGLFPSWEPTTLQIALVACIAVALAVIRHHEDEQSRKPAVAVARQTT